MAPLEYSLHALAQVAILYVYVISYHIPTQIRLEEMSSEELETIPMHILSRHRLLKDFSIKFLTRHTTTQW